MKATAPTVRRKLRRSGGAAQNDKPVKFLTYRGNVVGLFSNGDGTLKSRLMNSNPERLPKDKTLDLNKYCPGFDRSQIKRFKACVLKLAYA